MYTFPIYDFKYNVSINEHSEKRKKVEEIENYLIMDFVKKIW